MASPRPKHVHPTRKDPRPESAAAQMVMDQTALLNPDPAFKYKFVHPHAQIGGVRSHQQRGWSIVMDTPDGVKLAIGATSKEGEPMELEGLVLMQQPVDVWERNERDGSPGTGMGQRHFDLIEQMIADPSVGMDGIARQGGQYAQIVNETKPNRVMNAEL